MRGWTGGVFGPGGFHGLPRRGHRPERLGWALVRVESEGLAERFRQLPISHALYLRLVEHPLGV